ncbi:hypothetical protein MTsPCn9_19670 [Croceitalea sp. MTPC9]|uniref:toxin-antitoxin system YwqK family antitoxin n=1 Tax=unclassified Croceitalea TaxID=2632280 RepID=UPI002B3BF051|nr:hypothetical protein MTsPCn6_12520 [Croceitalea sp. MTPC6]GMN17031.1 hypothetical protein MTsPCn9_19670 [Croceitalea sp. MTPC9]
MLRFSLIVFILLFSPNKIYHRDYHDNGNLKSQGWKIEDSKEDFWKHYHANGQLMSQGHYKKNTKVGYWYFYDTNGRIEMEGHFKNNQKVKWWLFYDQKGKVNHKCQLKDGIKNGYCLKYMDEELTSAEKYRNGKKVKEWFSFSSFKKENKLSDLK